MAIIQTTACPWNVESLLNIRHRDITPPNPRPSQCATREMRGAPVAPEQTPEVMQLAVVKPGR